MLTVHIVIPRGREGGREGGRERGKEGGKRGRERGCEEVKKGMSKRWMEGERYRERDRGGEEWRE